MNRRSDISSMQQAHRSDLIFGHFEIPTSSGVGNVCVALLRPKKGSGSCSYKVAMAFGSPLDSPNRRVGRMIAAGRLFSNRPGRSFTFETSETRISRVMHDALARAFHQMLVKSDERGHSREINYMPLWATDALKSGADFCQV